MSGEGLGLWSGSVGGAFMTPAPWSGGGGGGDGPVATSRLGRDGDGTTSTRRVARGGLSEAILTRTYIRELQSKF